jgi:hypothetical protein
LRQGASSAASHAPVAGRIGTEVSVADGEGHNSVWLAEQGLEVTAVEISPIAVEKARRLAAGRKVDIGFLLHGYTPKQLEYKTGGPGDLENLYTREILREAFADWDIEELVEYEEEIAEGKGHKGRSALIGLVARKP